MEDFIIVVVIVVIIGTAVTYIRKAKKSGVKCIGCPSGGNCAHSEGKSSTCSCGCGQEGEGKEGCSGECHCHADAKE